MYVCEPGLTSSRREVEGVLSHYHADGLGPLTEATDPVGTVTVARG